MLDTAPPKPLRDQRRPIFEREHALFRNSARAFARKEAAPRTAEWEAAGIVDRAFWKSAATNGFIAFDVPEEFGGQGVEDFRYNTIIAEEMVYAGAVSDNFSLQNDVLAPYLVKQTNGEQKERWLPGFANGDLMFSIAMTEPGAGSDLRGIATVARRTDAGYAITGSKTYITSGIQSDLTIVACRLEDAPAGQLTLIAVERDRDGFRHGRSLHKIGRNAQDTAELFFDGVEVPAENRIGPEGEGLNIMKGNLPQERLSIAVTGVAGAEAAFDLALEYARERQTMGQPLIRHQALRHTLASMRADIDAGRSYLDRCLLAHVEGQLTAADAAAVKFWTTEMQFRVTDQALQLFGGFGYMDDSPISKLWRDCRVQRIYGGTTEIMKDILGRSLA